MPGEAHIEKVAVIGGSLAGLGAALDLARAGVAVSVYERDAEVLPDFEPPTLGSSAALLGLARRLGVDTQPRPDDSCVIDVHREPVLFQGDGGEITRFRRGLAEVTSDLSWMGSTVGEFLRQQGHTTDFVRTWFLPRALAWAGGELGAAGEAPLEALARAWHAHGLVGEGRSPMVIAGGAAALRGPLVATIEAAGGQVRTRSSVRLVRRTPSGVRIHCVQWGQGTGPEDADAVLVALNPDPARRIFADPTREEAELLRAIPTRICRVVRHTDHRLMPRHRAAWRATQYLLPPADGDAVAPSRTRWLNRTGEIPSHATYTFESWDPFLEPAEDRVDSDDLRTVSLPSAEGDSARRALTTRQGSRRTWFAGSWMRCPFTAEDGLRTGLNAAGEILEQRFVGPERTSAPAQTASRAAKS